MATLNEVCELVYRVLNPNASAQSDIKKEEVIAQGQIEYASSMWIRAKELEATEGFFEVPSYLLTEKEFDVKDNIIDLTDEPILNSLSNNAAIQDVGGLDCDCRYIKSTLNLEKKLCNDDSIGDTKTYFMVGKKLVFPKGTHKEKLKIIYANNGSDLNGEDVEVDDYVATKVRDKLMQIYGIKVPADHTANSNSNN